jgi:hypothetical protein
MARKWDIGLAWWLNLANLYQPPSADKLAESLEGEEFWRYWRSRRLYDEREAPASFAARVRRLKPSGHRPRGLDTFLNHAPGGNDECAYRLAQTAREILHRLATEKLRDIWMYAPTPQAAGALEMKVLDGQVHMDRIDPIASLCALLDGRKANVIGDCRVCGRLFERLRTDQECDTRRCRDTDRKRAYRKPEYEQTRQINRLVRAGMPLNQAKAEVQMKPRKRRAV